MKTDRSGYFGTPSQQELQRRVDQVWALVSDSSDYACHGRAVSLVQETEVNLDKQIALARLQGASGRDEVPNDTAEDRRRALEAHGLTVDENIKWQGQADTLKAARSVTAENALRDDLEIISVDSNTSVSDMAKLDALTQSCEVLLPMGSFIRGERRPSVCLFARDRHRATFLAQRLRLRSFIPITQRLAWSGGGCLQPILHGGANESR